MVFMKAHQHTSMIDTCGRPEADDPLPPKSPVRKRPYADHLAKLSRRTRADVPSGGDDRILKLELVPR
jgi:hypothetical protein